MKLGVTSLLAVLATPAVALTPLPPCHGALESGMAIGDVQILGGYEASGVTVETYFNNRAWENGLLVIVPAPVMQLNNFIGVRVTHCASGNFVAIPDVEANLVNAALAATEFLRGPVQSQQRMTFAQVQRAAKVVYGPVIRLRESEETCGCNTYFPGLKPASMPGFGTRTEGVRTETEE